MADPAPKYRQVREPDKRVVTAPELPYRPRDPQRYRPAIGLIGCGGITNNHLKAYRKAGYHVVALCDIDRRRAEDRQRDYYPAAQVYTDYHEVLARSDIEVVDITTHPAERGAIIEAALHSHKHVLSQKPFVLDLDEGERLAKLADDNGVRLAVNQNARWAPHYSYMRCAAEAGLLGTPATLACTVHWDHRWIAGSPFENVKHLILYDFAIHWFDLACALFAPREPQRVFASLARSPGQDLKPDLLGQAIIDFDDGQASLVFDAATPFGPEDRTYLRGTEGSIVAAGWDCKEQEVTLYTSAGRATPTLDGCWFPDGFHGTMGELLCAIEENREPSISARNNLKSLALCFAAVESAETGSPVAPATARRMRT
jgi:predicted dehydrogenase